MCEGNCKLQHCNTTQISRPVKHFTIIWWIVAILSLAGAWVYGYVASKANDIELLNYTFKYSNIEVISQKDRLFKLKREREDLFLALGNAWGYGGNMVVATITDSSGKVEDIVLVNNRETHAYIQRLKDRNYFLQYKGKLIDDSFSINHDLDAVSGATISSTAISRAVQEGGHTLAENYFHLSPKKINGKFQVSQSVIALIVFFLLSIFIFGRYRWLNIVLLVAAIAGIGIMWNNSFSITSLAKLFTGGFPNPNEDLRIYVFLVFIIGGIMVLKKNIYCFKICPFYGIQFLLNKLSGMRLEMHPIIIKYGAFVKSFLLWAALMIMFMSTSPTLSNFEPFAMVFSLEGHGIQWYIMPAVIVGALFTPSFFCRYFCPAGESLDILLDLRKGKILKKKTAKEKFHFKDLKIKKSQLLPSLLYFISLFVILMLLINSISSL